MPSLTSQSPSRKELEGLRIGFYTSVTGMGGSEVLVADAMEAASIAGATVICWSEPTAAIRRITKNRERLSVEHRDSTSGPRGNFEEPNLGKGEDQATPKRKGLSLSSMWRATAPSFLLRHVGFWRTVRTLRDQLRLANLDVLFVNVNGSEAASAAGQQCGLRVINCYHLSYTPSKGGPLTRLCDWAARRSTMRSGTLTIHTSAAVRDEWSRRFRYPISRTRLIYNGVDPSRLTDRSATRASLGLSESEFVFCIAGRLDGMKGHKYLIEALARLKERLGESRLLICGDGSLKEQLNAMVAHFDLQRTVTFLGWRNDLPAILQASDCTILPSTESENLSVAVLESLMAGTPAIVTNVGGMPEAVRDGETGFVVPPKDSIALATAIQRLIDDRQQIQQMRVKAMQDARVRFTRARMMAEYVAVFSEVAGR